MDEDDNENDLIQKCRKLKYKFKKKLEIQSKRQTVKINDVQLLRFALYMMFQYLLKIFFFKILFFLQIQDEQIVTQNQYLIFHNHSQICP